MTEEEKQEARDEFTRNRMMKDGEEFFKDGKDDKLKYRIDKIIACGSFG